MRNGQVNNILLVAITRMGDLLQASPTIVGLKQENPNAHLTVLVEKQFADICRGIPGIDELYEFDMALVFRCLQRERDGLVEAYKYVGKIVDELRAYNFDYCLNISSSGYTALLLKLLGIEDSRGWTSDDEGFRIISNPWAMLFAAFVYHSNRDYNSINLVDIFRCSAGVKAHPQTLIYDVPRGDEDFPKEFLGELAEGSGPLICIQAGASQEKRQWEPQQFAELTKILVSELNARIVFTGSTSEKPITEQIIALTGKKNIRDAVGETNLAQLAALLKCSNLLITGDTGPMHLSVAVGTPVVALFLASALCFETGPYSSGNFVLQPQVTCNPCNPNYACARPDCHAQISPELVAALVKLKLTHSRAADVVLSTALADPREVAVYYTEFDEDGFLEFRPVNGIAPRHGHSGEYFRAIRRVYRMLWKEQFGERAKPTTAPINQYYNGSTAESIKLSRALSQVINQCLVGTALLDELIKLIGNVNSPPRKLGEVNSAINRNSREVEDIGLGMPALGALIRLFIMERENMRGDDPLLLASEMKEIYRRLYERAGRFGELFDLYYVTPTAAGRVGRLTVLEASP